MKAINYFILNIIGLSIFFSCQPQDQQQQDLDSSTKAYFEVKNNSKFIFTELSDTNLSIEYTSSNYTNGRSNPDIENTEILFYDLNASNQATLTMRCQSGGTQFKDQIALITKKNDSSVIGPIVFNLGGEFAPSLGSGDSVFQYPTYQINATIYEDVVRVKLYNNIKYKEIYFAKNIGLVIRKEKNNKTYYVKRYSKM
jgi:hypothetical protein